MITPYQPAQPRYGSAAEFAKIIDAVTEQEVKPWHGENAEEKRGRWTRNYPVVCINIYII